MSDRTEALSKLDSWESLRARCVAACLLGATLITLLFVVSENAEDHWENLPLSLALATAGAVALTLCTLAAGMMLRWQTLPRRFTAPAAVGLLLAGVGGAAFCIVATNNAPRSPLGTVELQHAPAYLASLAAATFGAANWPSRAKAPLR